MKPMLVVGLGNTLVGDDGVGCRLVEVLARDHALRQRADFVVAGSDLLRLTGRLEGRECVLLIDAVLREDAPQGTVSIHEEPFDDLAPDRAHAHHPSVVETIGLLKATSPWLRPTPFILVGIAVHGLRHRATLSESLPDIAKRVAAALMSRFDGSGARGT